MLPDMMTYSFDDLVNTGENFQWRFLGLVVCYIFYFDIIAMTTKCISAFPSLEIIN